ncbi:DUF397 domain-containing protein [Streptomyces cremeus]|uniref:DUF397 domain-containing protein n=1 Tax=Streptomyces cremeus TaxID=66881 RepID=A0ABV5PAN5_STRCM
MSTGLNWFKSSYSGSQGECVEVATTRAGSIPTTIHIRDSKDVTRPSLTTTPTAWAAFLALSHTARQAV